MISSENAVAAMIRNVCWRCRVPDGYNHRCEVLFEVWDMQAKIERRRDDIPRGRMRVVLYAKYR